MTNTTAPFQTFEEASEWFAAGKEKHGARAFTATPEYREHYDAFRAIYDANKPNRDERKKAREERLGKLPRAVNLLAYSMHNA